MDLATARRSVWHLRHSGIDGLRQHRQRVRRAGQVRAVGEARTVLTRRDLSFAPWPLPPSPARREGLRVAVILDDFSRLAFGYEWTQVELTPQRWAQQVADGVDLLFVESAWRGNGGQWRGHLIGPNAPSPALLELVAWCKAHMVPTVFWNKEDPVHHEGFLATAMLFNHVLTTDGDLVDTYRTALGHNRVGTLPFAAQPAIHHPVRTGTDHASRDLAFAGTYYGHRYAERAEQVQMLVGAAAKAGATMEHGLEIFSRRFGSDHRYEFPAPLDAHVVGSLDYRSMLSAYRAYKVFLNVNTVVGSATMCARRVFEIAASGATVVSTPSPAITSMFSPYEVVQVAEPAQAESTLRALVANRELRDRMTHRAQRQIWAAHTYSHRADQVLDAAGIAGHRLTAGPRAVSVLVSSNRPHRLDAVLATACAQRNVAVQLVFVAHGWDADTDALRRAAKDGGLAEAVVLHADEDVSLGECLNRAVGAADAPVVARIDDDDVYGEHYLFDQLAALEYSGADVVGKHAHFVYLTGADVLALRFAEHEHRFSHFVAGPTIVARRDTAADVGFPPLPRGEDTGFLSAVLSGGGTVYSSDRFGFVHVRTDDTTAHTWTPADAEVLATCQVQGFGQVLDHALV
ncbi:MAG: glycosyltransferase [Micrococcales bacterium]|nr:glycosyltransferase [Micrococcales bacterium]MCL2667028.1 glycosyltransferase [Micrococcales bacterium]